LLFFHEIKVHSHLKISLAALCAMLIFASFNVCAELVSIPALKAHVTDLTKTLTQDQQGQLEAKLTAFEREKGSQIAILIVPTTEPEDIAQFSIRVVDVWKLGRGKTSDGVLITLDVKGKKSRIEVGYGLEGALNDLTAERIRVEVMRPFIRAGDIYGGLDAGINKIMNVISGEALPAPTASSTAFKDKSFENMLPILLFGGLVLGGMLRTMFGNFFGGALTGGALGLLAWMLGSSILAAVFFGVIAFLLTLIGPSSLGHMGGGGFGGGSSGGNDTFSGGGGGFGGGGASGDW
jgi:uncharacterized protein